MGLLKKISREHFFDFSVLPLTAGPFGTSVRMALRVAAVNAAFLVAPLSLFWPDRSCCLRLF
jgi:hypothetical protein